MDSQAQLQRTHAQHQAEKPIKIHHPEEEDHNVKGPAKVIKKVKEKAKKIKNALTKHGHGHEHDRGGHIPDDHDLEEEDDEDDDEYQELHGGAPARGKAQHIPDQRKEQIDPPGTRVFPAVSSSHTKPSGVSEKEERRGAPTLTPHNTPVSLLSATEDAARTFVPGEQRRVNIERPRGLEEDHAAPGGRSGSLGGMSNYQSKVTDPTGKAGGEIGAAPALAALRRRKGTGEDDQYGLGRDLPVRRHGFGMKWRPEMGNHLPAGSHGSGLREEFPARSHEFDVKSGADLGKDSRAQGSGDDAQQPNQSSYTDKIAGVVTPVYEKVKETGASVMTKLPFSGGGTGTETETQQGQDKGVSAKEYLTEKLSPGEEDKALSEVVVEKLHLGGDTTAPAKKGTVTQSEEVEKRLGGFGDQRSEKERKYGEAFAEKGEGGMVEKLKGAVTSWVTGTTDEVMQKSTESVQDSSQSVGATVGNMGFSGSGADGAGQRSGDKSGSVPVQKRFQESGN